MRVFGWNSMRSSQWWSAAIPCLGGASTFSVALGAMIIQSVNTGILLSAFLRYINLIIKAVIVLIILIMQSLSALQSTGESPFFPAASPREVRAELSK